MPYSVIAPLTPVQIAEEKLQASAVTNAGKSLLTGREFVFFGAFDGTNNDLNDLDTSGESIR
jgi:hypothetical protein